MEREASAERYNTRVRISRRFCAAVLALPGIVRAHYGRGVGSYGLFFSLMAAGMVVGSLVWARWHPRRHSIRISSPNGLQPKEAELSIRNY